MIRNSTRVRAAIAFMGTNSSKLAPLGEGDTLVVDMSMRTVKQGLTDPREISKLIQRGGYVYTRSGLHAKCLVCDQTLLIGSANASQNSARYLDEAAVVVHDTSAVRMAGQFVSNIAVTPVRPEYLRRCLEAYRPRPSYGGRRTRAEREVLPPSLWIIGGLKSFDVPAAERRHARSLEQAANRLRQHGANTYVDQVFYRKRLKFLQALKPGAWALMGIREEDGIWVYPPRQLLSIGDYPRVDGGRRWVLNFEAPESEEAYSLAEFRRKTRRVLSTGRTSYLPTRAIRQPTIADSLHRLWTSSGRCSSRAG